MNKMEKPSLGEDEWRDGGKTVKWKKKKNEGVEGDGGIVGRWKKTGQM